MTDAAAESQTDIVAGPGKYYRNARYIIVAMALGAGLWFAYDGFVKWPNQLSAFQAMTAEQQAGQRKPHAESDIVLQQRIAIVLLAAAPLMLGFFLYRSRGSYRLTGTTLQVPGHPPVPFEAIVGIDKSKWERKGIAGVDYMLEERGAVRRLILDDFVYDQAPTDEIVKRIDAYLESMARADEEDAES